MSPTLAVVFIVGKAAIWLLLPLALGVWELRRHRRMMAAEARGAPAAPSVPRWLQAAPGRAAVARPDAPAEAPAPVEAPQREAA